MVLMSDKLYLACRNFVKLKEALIKIRLKVAFAPLTLGGIGGGAQLRQREKQNTCVRGLSARAGSFD